MYSFSHCLTMIPMEAAERLKMRLENQRPLIQMAKGGVDGGASIAWGVDAVGIVAFTKGRLIVKLSSCNDMWWRDARIGSISGSAKSWYDSTMNAVNTAEKRPA